MNGRRRAVRMGALLIGLALTVGCISAKPFVYQPSGPAPGVALASPKVAVLPFADGTEEFVERIVYGKERTWNLARKGYSHFIGAVPPELWAKALADDLAASGRFRGVRYVYDRSELRDEDYVIEGTLLKAYIFGPPPGAWSLALRAYATRDHRLVSERQVSRTWTQWDIAQLHPWLNQTMQEMFAEAGAELARAVGGPSLGVAPRSNTGTGDAAAPATQETVDDTVKRIMEGR